MGLKKMWDRHPTYFIQLYGQVTSVICFIHYLYKSTIKINFKELLNASNIFSLSYKPYTGILIYQWQELPLKEHTPQMGGIEEPQGAFCVSDEESITQRNPAPTF